MANSVTFDTRTPVDFAIIGSGSAGGIIAKELSTAGFDVVLFEQGKYRKASEFTHDELGMVYRHELEAGVIHFFDKAFATDMSDKLDEARTGLEALNAEIPGGEVFAELSTDAQNERLRAIEGTAFFDLMRQMTIFGFLAMSEYGGNRDHVGWDLIGFKGHNGGWQYPFGYYDAQVHEGSDYGE